MPTMTMFADGLQEQLVFLEGPPPLSERRVEGMYPALSTSLVRSTLNKFRDLYPIDLLARGWDG